MTNIIDITPYIENQKALDNFEKADKQCLGITFAYTEKEHHSAPLPLSGIKGSKTVSDEVFANAIGYNPSLLEALTVKPFNKETEE